MKISRSVYETIRRCFVNGSKTPYVSFEFDVPEDGTLPYAVVVATGQYAARLMDLVVKNGLKYDVEFCPICGKFTLKKIGDTWQCTNCNYFERDVNGMSEGFHDALKNFRVEAIRRSAKFDDLK